MRRMIGLSLCFAVALALSGCGTDSAKEPNAAHEQTKQTLTFDDLAGATRVVMTTKAESDLPKTWQYKDEEATQKAQALVPVLKEGKPLAAGEKTAQGEMPVVIFILDVDGQKAGINVFENQFEFNGKWYALEKAPERTYGSVEQLKKIE
ncbi:MAG TPA: hypothetical protein VFV52_00785 [Bacilli bacterium]|nr:hypothetical protein [Bacilli bacterium]